MDRTIVHRRHHHERSSSPIDGSKIITRTYHVDEHAITNAHLDGAMMIGSSIACTTGVYPAELQAVARALAMLPASYDVRIHTDSRSSIDAIIKYEQQLNE